MPTIQLTYGKRQTAIFHSVKRLAQSVLDADLTNEEFVVAIARDFEARHGRKKNDRSK